MATFDQLSEEQRAILELLLRRGQSYKDLSGKLDLPEGRVRELARDALVELAPVTAKGVESDWRSQLSDYVLGQQSGPESTATRGHLRRSEPLAPGPARCSTRSTDSTATVCPPSRTPSAPAPARPSARASARRRRHPRRRSRASRSATRQPRRC